MVTDDFLLSIEGDHANSIAWTDPLTDITAHTQLFFNTGRPLLSSQPDGGDGAIFDTKTTEFALARINPMH